jgi:flagellar hook-length control protein FliK
MTPTTLAVPVVAPTPAAPAATPAAEQGAPADFLLMLGQLAAGAAPQQGIGGTTAPRAVAVMDKGDDALTDATNAVDVAALFPLSLPLTPPEVRPAASPVSDATPALVTQAPSGGTSTVAAEAELVTRLIGSDDADDSSPATFEIPQLPVQAPEARATQTNAPPPHEALARPVHPPVGSRAWADEIGSRVLLMTEHGRQTASLRLSPEHLGPLEIQVAIQDDRASVWFGAAHADTRAAIETALPRLRELFASQGLSLADAGVFREPPRQQAAPTTHMSDSGENEAIATVERRIRLGLIDDYA